MKTSNLLYLIAFILIAISACSDKDEPSPSPQGPKSQIPLLTVAEANIIFDRLSSSQTTQITAQNLQQPLEITSSSTWCIPELSSDSTSLTISCTSNQEPITRTASISLKSGKVARTIIVKQRGRNDSESGIVEDIKLNIAQATASSFQDGEEIEKSFDGNHQTMYHSKWDNSASNYFPITLTYTLAATDSLNYIIYYPRSSGANGRFKQFEIYTINDSGQETKQGDYSLPSTSTPSRITFDNTILEVKTIKFVINEGYGDGKGFASCAEMEFYKNNPNKFDYTTIFTDPSCSELKTGIGMEQINKIKTPLFRELATEIYQNEYDHEFRVQSYRSWQHPDIMARKNKTSTYGLRDNPTGMYANEGDEIIVLADNTHNQNISVFIQNPDKTINGTSFPIHTGVNRFNAPHAGLMYVMYYTNTGEEPAVKLHFAKGNVNGYFDKTKHTNDDYNRLINKAPFRHFDMIGEYAVITFETAAFKEYTKTEGMKLISAYDDIVYHEQDFMGLFKYDRAYKNKAYFVVVYGDAYMYSTSYHTAYNKSTQKGVLDPNKVLKDDIIWGLAHELGHTHQTRPGLKWHGMTEVTNNIHSLYLQTLFGNASWLDGDKDKSVYSKALKSIVEGEAAHNSITDVFVKLVPFWQLKLYCVDALGMADFYKDVYEKVRVNPNPPSQGKCQLQFTKICSEVAQLDLTDFFEKWGFFRPIDIEINDYGKAQFTITQEEIDAIKEEIKALNLPKPEHDNIHLITDSNVSDYKK